MKRSPARPGCSRTRCWSATSPSGSRPLRARASSATCCTGASERGRSRSARRCGRPPRSQPRRDASRGRGIVVLHVRTVDGSGEPILDFWRAPLLPLAADGSGDADDLALVGEPVDATTLVPHDWRLDPLRAEPLGALFADLRAGDTYEVEAAETVTAATELARLSLNLAHTHTDASVGAHGERLVYGGHVIGVAAAHLTRRCPIWRRSWRGSRATTWARSFEGDRLRSRIEITGLEPLADGGLAHLRVLTAATGDAGPPRDVLDWRLVALMP